MRTCQRHGWALYLSSPHSFLVVKPDSVLVVKPDSVLVVKPDSVLVVKPDSVLVVKPDSVLVVKPTIQQYGSTYNITARGEKGKAHARTDIVLFYFVFGFFCSGHCHHCLLL